MKTNLNRLLCICAAALLPVCSLAACGSDASDGRAETLEPQDFNGMLEPEEWAGSTAAETEGSRPAGQIEEQSFEVELDGWGRVTFASFQPVQSEAGNSETGGVLPGDVRFMLLCDDQVVYEFPERAPAVELSEDYVFREVLAVAFRDYNEDGRTDILILLEYGNLEDDRSFHLARAYTQEEGEKEFFTDDGLSYYLLASFRQGYTENMDGILEGIEAYSKLYETCTGLSAFEVERFARRVRKLILEGDCESLAEECAYPLTVDGREYEDKETLLASGLLLDPEQDFLEAMEQETCGNLFCSWQGIMLGNGKVWIRELLSEDMTSQGLKITALNGLK